MNTGATGTTCSAVGGTTTTENAYSPAEVLTADLNDSDTSFSVTAASGSGTIAAGQTIEIDDEEMLVNTVTSGTTQTITVTRAQDDTEADPHTAGTPVYQSVTTPNGTAYNPAKTLSANIGIASPITFGVNSGTGISIGDVVQIDSEAMTVMNVSGNNLTVTRGADGTKIAAHNMNAPLLQVSSAGASPPSVTLAPGTYIMAGGGFAVCGAASLSIQSGSPGGVMIYNTDDSAQGTKVAYNPNVTLNAAAGASTTTSGYTPNAVTLPSAVGTSSNQIPYNPAVTLNAAAVSAPSPVAYTPNNVTLSAPASNGPSPAAYTPNNVTLSAALANGPSSAAYTPAQTLQSAITTAGQTPITIAGGGEADNRRRR